MKIAFVHLGRENLGIEYLSAVLKQDGHAVTLHYDPGLFGINDNVFYVPRLEKRYARDARIVDEIVIAPPDLLCFSVYTGTYQWCLDIARRVRDRVPCPIVFGGIHVTLVPHEVLKHEVVDYALVGEGEGPCVSWPPNSPPATIRAARPTCAGARTVKCAARLCARRWPTSTRCRCPTRRCSKTG
jgi:hypothetical protein